MMFADDGVVIKEDATVEVTASEYAKLVQIADRYHTIIELAFRKTSLNWRQDVDLNGDDVLDYIRFIEHRRVEAGKAKLLAKEKAAKETAQEAAK